MNDNTGSPVEPTIPVGLTEGVSSPRPGNGAGTTTRVNPTINGASHDHPTKVRLPTDSRSQMAQAIAHVLQLAGENMGDPREDMKDTPYRFADALMEFYVYQPEDLVKVLKNGFETPSEDTGMIVQQSIPFRALCPHHLFPVLGEAHIGYIPRKRIVGLSKLARIVDVAGAIRPATQEEITGQVAAAIVEVLEPVGVIVVIKATHTCMVARGIRAHTAITTTSVVKGVFRDVPSARQEFMDILKVGSHG